MATLTERLENRYLALDAKLTPLWRWLNNHSHEKDSEEYKSKQRQHEWLVREQTTVVDLLGAGEPEEDDVESCSSYCPSPDVV